MRKLLELARTVAPESLAHSRRRIVSIKTRGMLGGQVVRKCVVEAA